MALGIGTAHATTISYNGFASTSGLTLQGNTTTTTTGDGTVLRITGTSGNEAGAAYSTSPITLGANATFSTRFKFRFTDPSGGVDPADGITFVLAASPSGLGTPGYGMGYEGVGHSVAIEFDTYNNGNPSSFGPFPAEPDSSNHVAIDTAGSLTNTAWTNVYGNGSCGFSNGTPPQNDNTVDGCMSNGHLWTVDITYNGALLNVSLRDPSETATFDALTNYSIDVGSILGTNIAYVGFTGSNGAGWENQDIVNWEFANTATLPSTDVPEPGALLLLGAGLLGVCLVKSRSKQRMS